MVDSTCMISCRRTGDFRFIGQALSAPKNNHLNDMIKKSIIVNDNIKEFMTQTTQLLEIRKNTAHRCIVKEVLCEFLCYHEDETDRLLMGKEMRRLNIVCADIG